jgi:hypothetical protein
MMTSLFSSKRSSALALLMTAFGSLMVHPAAAQPEYPGYIRDHLQMACTPRCTLCHEVAAPTSAPKEGTPFFEAFTREGVIGGELENVKAALDRMATEGTDSDGDQVADIVELKPSVVAPPPGMTAYLASNPNGEGDICASEVDYGCGAQMAGGPAFPAGLDAMALAALTGGALLVTRRRARA